MGLLNHKTAIITCASSGIGRATAKLFASEGPTLSPWRGAPRCFTGQTGGRDFRRGRSAIALAADASDERCAKEAVSLALGRFGGLDIAFNNAGALGTLGSLPDLALADWQQTLDSNLTSAFLCAKYQIPAMVQRENTSLIFTSSFVGHALGLPGMAAYAALVGLARSLAAEYGAHGLRVNALLPGGTDTEMGQAACKHRNSEPGWKTCTR
nr:SDR family NAD(P)-dependent oxidoreductase [Chromobacterium sphagni]